MFFPGEYNNNILFFLLTMVTCSSIAYELNQAKCLLLPTLSVSASAACMHSTLPHGISKQAKQRSEEG